MRLKKIKKASDFKLKGIKITVDTADSCLSRVTLTDDDGNFVTFERENHYGDLRAYVKDAPKMADRYAVKAEVVGEKIEKVFDGEYEAKALCDELKSKGIEATVEKVSVEVDDL